MGGIGVEKTVLISPSCVVGQNGDVCIASLLLISANPDSNVLLYRLPLMSWASSIVCSSGDGYLSIEVNVEGMGIDCVRDDSKDVIDFIHRIFAIGQFNLLDDMNVAPSERGLVCACFRVLCDRRNLAIHFEICKVEDCQAW